MEGEGITRTMVMQEVSRGDRAMNTAMQLAKKYTEGALASVAEIRRKDKRVV